MEQILSAHRCQNSPVQVLSFLLGQGVNQTQLARWRHSFKCSWGETRKKKKKMGEIKKKTRKREAGVKEKNWKGRWMWGDCEAIRNSLLTQLTQQSKWKWKKESGRQTLSTWISLSHFGRYLTKWLCTKLECIKMSKWYRQMFSSRLCFYGGIFTITQIKWSEMALNLPDCKFPKGRSCARGFLWSTFFFLVPGKIGCTCTHLVALWKVLNTFLHFPPQKTQIH